MIPKKRKRERMNVRPPEKIRSDGHMAFVRNRYCLVYAVPVGPGRIRCGGKVQACHVRIDMHGTGAAKSHDSQTIPLCLHHHRQLDDQLGRDEFERVYGLRAGTLLETAAQLWQADTYHRLKHEAKMRELENA